LKEITLQARFENSSHTKAYLFGNAHDVEVFELHCRCHLDEFEEEEAMES
jgi:hypothetical protein